MQHFDGTENTAVKFPRTKVIERTSMTRYFTGNIDELRISKGVLAPSQFLKWSKKPRGMALIYH